MPRKMREVCCKETPLSQSGGHCTAVGMTALALLALVRPSLAQSNPVEMTVGNYTVVYMQDKTDLRWNFTEAQHYCQQRFGTSLASFHQVGSIRDVYQAIDDARGKDHSGTRVRYRFGLHCEEEFTPEYEEYKGKRSLPLWQYSDGTIFDYGFADESIVFRDMFGGGPCPKSLVVDAIVRPSNPWDLNSTSLRTSALICNVHSNENWQSMNPPRTEFIICDENKDCILDCSQPPQCQYYRNTDIKDLSSLDVRTDRHYGGFGMTIAAANVSSVTVVGTWASRWGAFEGATMSFSNCTDVSINTKEQNSLRVGLFILDSNQAVLFKPEYIAGSLITLISTNSDQIIVDCQSSASCRHMKAEFTNVRSVTYLCKSCYIGNFVFRQVARVDISCHWVNPQLRRGCHESRFSIDGSNVTEPTSVNISCFGNFGCMAQEWTIKGYDTVSLSCQSENSCDLGAPFGSVFTFIPNVIVDCEASGSCTPLWTDSPITVSEFESVSLRCHASQSCYFDFPLIFVDDGPFHFELHSTEADSFDFTVLGNFSEASPIAENREVWVFCEDFRSCSDDESEGTPLGSMIANVSGFAVSLVVECRGRESCVGSDLSVLSEQSGISVVCSGQKSCDSARVNGYCARMTDVRITADIEDMTVICPSTLTSDSCRVLIQKGQLSNSRIGMSDSDWDSDKFNLEGQNDAFVQVTSLHLDSDEQDSCEEAGSASQAECFLVFNGNRRWIESLSCSNFVMSLYSPMTILVGSLTTLFGALFLIAAMNQTNRDEIPLFWIHNCMTVTLALVSFTAVISSLILLSYQTEAQSQITLGDPGSIPISFHLCSLLNLFLFAIFLSVVECWLVFSEKDSWNHVFSSLRKTLDPSELRTGRVLWIRIAMCVVIVRMIQMLIFYAFSHIDWMVASVMCITVDIMIILPSRVGLVLIGCFSLWLFISQYSPISLLSDQPTFFEVITANTADETSLIWFDVFVMELLFGSGCIVISGDGPKKMKKIRGMFLQFFDLSTDLCVIAFWFASGKLLWAGIESTFVLGAAIVQWLVIRTRLQHWKEHAMVLCTMARGYSKVRLWYDKKGRWFALDKECSLLETFFESLPSMMFGLFLFMSDAWKSELDGDFGVELSDELGPLLVSMFSTAMSVANKTLSWTSALKVRNRFKAALYAFTMTDYVMRSVPLVLCFALLQSDTNNERVSIPLISAFPAIMVVLMAEQSAIIRICVQPDQNWVRLAMIYSFPSILSCAPVLFPTLKMKGIPHYFDRHRFLRCHMYVSLRSLIMFVLCVSIKPRSMVVFLGVNVAFLACLVLNLGVCFPVIWLMDPDQTGHIPRFQDCFPTHV